MNHQNKQYETTRVYGPARGDIIDGTVVGKEAKKGSRFMRIAGALGRLTTSPVVQGFHAIRRSMAEGVQSRRDAREQRAASAARAAAVAEDLRQSRQEVHDMLHPEQRAPDTRSTEEVLASLRKAWGGPENVQDWTQGAARPHYEQPSTPPQPAAHGTVYDGRRH